MALTYLPNANEVHEQAGRSVQPFIAVAIIAVALVAAAWVLLGSAGSDGTVATPTVTRVVSPGVTTVAGREIAVYGTPGEYFNAGFRTTPYAAADTGGLVANFPAGSSVSGYAVTRNPVAVYENVAQLPSVPTYVVQTATFPKGTIADNVFANLKSVSYLKAVTVDGFKGYAYVGPVDAAINKGISHLDPKAQESVLFLAKGRTGYIVGAFAADAASAKAFMTSFRPVKNSKVLVPITGAR